MTTIAARAGLALLLAFATRIACAEGQAFKVPTRPGVETTVFWEAQEGAKATLFMFTGGGGGYGKVVDGKPSSGNFLARTEAQFLAQGYNVAIFGRPSDSEGLEYADRISANHLADVRAVLDFVKAKSAAPVWLVGTSRGTVSAAYTAINVPDIAGLVLTSSIVSRDKPGALPKQDLAAIKVPVLVVHHADDACVVCHPYEVPAILSGLKNAPVKKLVMLHGGEPRGDACEPFHYHGYAGIEQQAVDTIANWIKQPVN